MQSVVLFTHGFQHCFVGLTEIYEALPKYIPERIVRVEYTLWVKWMCKLFMMTRITLIFTEGTVSSIIWLSQQRGAQTSVLPGIGRLRYIWPFFPFTKPSVNCIASGPHWVRKWPVRMTLWWGVVTVWLPPQYRLHRWSLVH